MRKGLAISLSAHAAILFWAVAVFPSARDLDMAAQPIPVEVVTSAEVSQLKAGKKDAEKTRTAALQKRETPKPVKAKEKKKEPTKLKRVKAPAPAPKPRGPSEPAPKPVAETPEPKPEKKAKAAPPLPMPLRKPASAPKFTEALKPERKVAKAKKPVKKAFDPDRISALLDKRPDSGALQPAAPERKPLPPKPAQGLAQGRDAQMTLSEIDALRARISQCWSPPTGGLGADAIKVKLRLQLDSDGMLANRPQVVNRGGSPFFLAAADSAVRAVMLCQPYQLPATKYALWKDMILNFDPREMFGG